MRRTLAKWVNAGRLGLYRDTQHGWISGVCAGIAERLTIKPIWVRLAFLTTVPFDRVAPTVVVYVLLMLVLERRGAVPVGMPRGTGYFADRYQTAPAAMPHNGGIAEVSARFAALDARLNRIEAAVMSDDLTLRRKFRELGS